MNLPFFSYLAWICAEQCPDSWIRKIQTEAVQLLWTAFRHNDWDTESLHATWADHVKGEWHYVTHDAQQIKLRPQTSEWHPRWNETTVAEYKNTHTGHPIQIWMQKDMRRCLHVARIGLYVALEFYRRYRTNANKNEPHHMTLNILLTMVHWFEQRCEPWTEYEYEHDVRLPMAMPSYIVLGIEFPDGVLAFEDNVLLADTATTHALYRAFFCIDKDPERVCQFKKGVPPPSWYTHDPLPEETRALAAAFAKECPAKVLRLRPLTFQDVLLRLARKQKYKVDEDVVRQLRTHIETRFSRGYLTLTSAPAA